MNTATHAEQQHNLVYKCASELVKEKYALATLRNSQYSVYMVYCILYVVPCIVIELLQNYGLLTSFEMIQQWSTHAHTRTHASRTTRIKQRLTSVCETKPLVGRNNVIVRAGTTGKIHMGLN